MATGITGTGTVIVLDDNQIVLETKNSKIISSQTYDAKFEFSVGDIVDFIYIGNKYLLIYPAESVKEMLSTSTSFPNEGDEVLISDILNSKDLEIIIDPGTATPQQIGEFLGELSVLYQMMGGSGISFSPDGIKVLINS